MVETLRSPIGVSDIGRFKYKLQRSKDDESTSNVIKTQLSAGDPIVISTEHGHYALAIGFLEEVTTSYVTIALDREITGGPKRTSHFHPHDSQDHDGWVTFATKWGRQGATVERTVTRRCPKQVLYRIDLNEMTGGMGVSRFNILQLFTPNGDEKGRRRVVDLDSPKFCSAWKDIMKKEHPKRYQQVESILESPKLNSDQREALQKTLNGNHDQELLSHPPPSHHSSEGLFVNPGNARDRQDDSHCTTHFCLECLWQVGAGDFVHAFCRG